MEIKGDIVVHNLIFEKSIYAFEKFNEYYLVIVNVKHNSLFVYDKDVRVIWNLINEKTMLDNLYDKLIIMGYKLEKKELYDIIDILAKSGILICDIIEEDLEYIKENNQLEDYCNECMSHIMPTTLHIELTNNCNLKCIHCFHDEIHNSLSFDELNELFGKLRKSQFVKVTLTGGEITTLPYWREIVKSAKRNGMIVSILSSFTLMDYSDVDFILDTNIHSIKTSLYGSTPEVHDSITGVKGSFKKTFNILNYMAEKEAPVAASCTIMKNNVEQILDLKNIIDKLGVKILFDYIISPSRSNTKDVEKISITSKEFKYFAEQGILQKPKRILCSACKYRIRISQTGEIYSCESLSVSLGNIRKDNLLDVINGAEIKKLAEKIAKYDPEECNGCKYDKYCTRCPALIWNKPPYENIHSELLCFYTKIACE